MKKILIFLLIISLFLIEGCATIVGSAVGSGIYKENLHNIEKNESTDINEPANQPAEISVHQNISFQAKENPFIVVSFRDQQIEGLLMGMEADSVLLGSAQSSLEFEPKRISIDEIQIIIVKKKSKFLPGFGYGLLIGGVAGVIVGSTSEDAGGFGLCREGMIGIGLGIGGLLGGTIGGVAGALEGKDQRFDLSQKSYYEKIIIVKRLLKGN